MQFSILICALYFYRLILIVSSVYCLLSLTFHIFNHCFSFVSFYGVGGWWQVEKFDDITGAVSIEIGSMQYLQAQDNGLFIVGPQHNIGALIYLAVILQRLSACV